ncbi:MAG: hypothetical protein PHY14_01960 [Candidatus Gracilibacteria bacterium]|nr:hypothetical protein [Candidatus Gracilibacteria bacterium]
MLLSVTKVRNCIPEPVGMIGTEGFSPRMTGKTGSSLAMTGTWILRHYIP